ncbi:DEAD/DEAH box helicase [Gracilibacillus dipsosauri]|uniref:DNA/RNA helicase n=1 Tax=Gracilibacillus dipsosauri TaxID=178340 RepID=A0A317L2T3_9BACI|nr:helicase-related protein [Gracilibacillus dipsosauri]PWU69310.1 DNA/RNA helicase [Gracilibacillus dipsosauri]
MKESHYLAGKILLREEINIHNDQFHHLIELGYLQSIPAITRKFHQYKCNRCHTTTLHHFGKIPCSRCQTTHVYCRNCIQTGRVLFCEELFLWTGPDIVWPQQKNPCYWDGTLTKHQQLAANAILHATSKPKQELLIWAVCGAGKTEMLYPAITEAIRHNKRICLATPRADVVQELYPRLKEVFPNTEMEALYGGTGVRTGVGQLIIATTHQLIRYQNAFDLLIIDELDAFPFHHDPLLHQFAVRSAKKYATKIYLTATPRPKQKRLIESNKLKAIFVPIRFHGYPLPVPRLRLELGLKRKISQNKMLHSLEAFLDSHDPKRQWLLFVPTIQLLTPFAKLLEEKGLDLATVHADDPKRKEKITAYREGKINVLITTTILERGVTFPSIDVVMIDAGHDVFDEAAIVQIAGRAGRSPKDPTGDVLLIHQGKTEAMIQAVKQIKRMNQKGKAL